MNHLNYFQHYYYYCYCYDKQQQQQHHEHYNYLIEKKLSKTIFKIIIKQELLFFKNIIIVIVIVNIKMNQTDNLNNNNLNENELLLIELLLGPIRDPLTTVIPMTILYIVILITGIIGNVCTCIVIVYNRYMHTATNFYLFSLAISDLLLLLLGLPQELYLLWQKYPYIFGEFFCIVRGLSSETSTNASILTITAFTVERYVAICHPLKSHTMSQLPRAIKIILIIWAVSAICALPVAWQFGIIFMINKSKILRNISRQCGIKVIYYEYGFETSAIVFFLIPITIISILYIFIGINLRKNSTTTTIQHQQNQNQNNNNILINQNLSLRNDSSTTTTTLLKSLSSRDISTKNLDNDNVNNNSINSNNSNSNHRSSILYQRNNSISSSYQKQIASRRSVIRMLVAVVIAFFFCYSPFHAQRVLATSMHRYKIKSSTIHYVYIILTHISGITYYLSATINPILYQLMSRKFRLAFKDTFSNCCPCWKTRTIPEITYMNIYGGSGINNNSYGNNYYLSSSSSYYLNRSPSFHQKYSSSFRRPSSYTNIDNPATSTSTSLQQQQQRRYSSIKSIHSFDPVVDVLLISNNKNVKIIDCKTSQASSTSPTLSSSPTSPISLELQTTSTTEYKESNFSKNKQQNEQLQTTKDNNEANNNNNNNNKTSTSTNSELPQRQTTLVKFKQFLEVPSVKF